ncbi:MAG: type I restriction endonuclease subunit R [Coriobacteriia bacterium]|nr:type I restriction endonuclease subunit R [Coriobacteriia bacterium]
MPNEKAYTAISQNSESTVVSQYEPVKKNATAYQSEAQLEANFIDMLQEQGYEYLTFHHEEELINNLRTKLEELNDFKFTDKEWDRFFNENIANTNEGIKEKAEKIQEKDTAQLCIRDDGSTKNIRLLDKKNVHNNRVQVINQYEVGQEQGAKHDNRYDVTILVNGLPLVHVELKRRGIILREAFNQIERYQRESFWAGCGLFEYVQIFVISNGTETKYYSNTTREQHLKDKSNNKTTKTSNSFEFTIYWSDAENKLILDLVDFTRTFFAKHTILNILNKYCVFTYDKLLMVMRPYQIIAAERIINRIVTSTQYKTHGSTDAGGYIWHSTGSGKTLTSFKASRLASLMPDIDKVLFVVDRKDLDYQTMCEYNKFEEGCANGNKSTAVLKRQLEDDSKIIITTIQKLSILIEKYKNHEVFSKHVVLIFDECHRGHFGDMHAAITKNFKKYHIFGFTGTPIFSKNAGSGNPNFCTTDQAFGDRLHTYTIVDAIKDKNVLPFKVDYCKTMNIGDAVQDEDVYDIKRDKALRDPRNVSIITKYILDNFNDKTKRNVKSMYEYKVIENISDYIKSSSKVKKHSAPRKINGFNSIFAVSSIDAAMQYYSEFKKQMEETPSSRKRIALIYSYGANEGDKDLHVQDGFLDEENSDDTKGLSLPQRDFLDSAIDDYNKMFNTNYSTSGEGFQNYYKDVSLRMKNMELDILIVVNMFLTGFDATTLNTLWVDKNLRMHGLIQAFSRTNRILNSVKSVGNIVCFRNLEDEVNEAVSAYGDKESGGVVVIRKFEDYYYGYNDEEGKHHKGYWDIIGLLRGKFNLDNFPLASENAQKEFVNLFGAFLRMRNLLTSFDDFQGKEEISDYEVQNYSSFYQDIREDWKHKIKEGESVDIADDVVFEIELLKSVDINIDYILMLVKKYHDKNCQDKEVLANIGNAIDGSPSLRSKKKLIENFIASLNESSDVYSEWLAYIKNARDEEIEKLIAEDNLNPEKTWRYIRNSFRDGELSTDGRYIDDLLPPMSLFGETGKLRSQKKQSVIEKLKAFFEKFRGVGAEEF